MSRLSILSSMAGAPWGGSEELWAALAEEALREGWEVLVCVWRWPEVPRRLADLEQQGVRIIRVRRIFANRPRLAGLWWNLWRPLRDVCSFQPDILVVSQGTAMEISFNQALLRALVSGPAHRTPLVLICQGADDGLVPSNPLVELKLRGRTQAAASRQVHPTRALTRSRPTPHRDLARMVST